MDPTNNIPDDEPEEIETPEVTDGADSPETPGEQEPAQETEADLLKAVSGAIDEVSDKPKGGTDAKEGEETPADATQARERDEHGRFKAKSAKTETPAAPDPKAAAKPGEQQQQQQPTPKQPDPVNDPIPQEVKGKTRERMEALVKKVKELEPIAQERDRAIADRDELLGMIKETRATPEQFGEVLDYLRAVNSGDPTQIRIAIRKVQDELNALSRMVGEPVPGVDLLAEHADLKEAVEAGTITQELAQELAAARSMRTVQTQASERYQQLSQAEQQAQQAIAAGRTALNTLEAQLRAADPLYDKKRELLVPMMQPIITQLPPDKWAAAFKTAYDKLPATVLQPAPNPTPTQQPSGQPLRARQPAGQGARAPSSMLDALSAAIDQVSAR